MSTDGFKNPRPSGRGEVNCMQWMVRESTKGLVKVRPRNGDSETLRSERDRAEILRALVTEVLPAHDIAARVDMPVNRVVSLLGRMKTDGLVNFVRAQANRPAYWFRQAKGK